MIQYAKISCISLHFNEQAKNEIKKTILLIIRSKRKNSEINLMEVENLQSENCKTLLKQI